MDVVNASFSDAFFEDKYMWVFDNRIQAICRVDIDSMEMKIISHYAGREEFIAYDMFSFQNRLYLATRETFQILIYDRDKQEEKEPFSLQHFSGDKEASSTDYGICCFKGCIYFLPRELDKSMVCFDMIEKKYEQKVLPVCLKENKVRECHLHTSPYSFYKETAYFTIDNTNYYGKYNVIQKKIEIFQDEGKEHFLELICFDGTYIWLTENRSGNILCEGRESVKIPGEQSYSRLYNMEKFIIAIPKYSDRVILVEKETLEAFIISLPYDEREKQRKTGYRNTVKCCEIGELIYLFPHGIKDMFIINKKTLQAERVKIKCRNYIKNGFRCRNILLYENVNINLASLLQIQENESDFLEEDCNCTGNTIWKNVSFFV